MMANEMRDRLVELLLNGEKQFFDTKANKTTPLQSYLSNYLIENGVIVPPCKVGDTVYILEEKCKYSGEKNEPWNSCNQYWDNVYKNGMWGCAGKDKTGNKIYCKKKEMVWYIKEVEYSLSLYSDPTKVLGENLFLTKAEAEQKLKEMRGGNDA